MAPLRSYALIVIATAHAHYVWQTTSGAETTVAFSENGLPGNKNILGAIVNITTGRFQPVGGAAWWREWPTGFEDIDDDHRLFAFAGEMSGHRHEDWHDASE